MSAHEFTFHGYLNVEFHGYLIWFQSFFFFSPYAQNWASRLNKHGRVFFMHCTIQGNLYWESSTYLFFLDYFVLKKKNRKSSCQSAQNRYTNVFSFCADAGIWIQYECPKRRISQLTNLCKCQQVLDSQAHGAFDIGTPTVPRPNSLSHPRLAEFTELSYFLSVWLPRKCKEKKRQFKSSR